MFFFYNLFLYSVYPLVLVAGLFSKKLRQNIKIRRPLKNLAVLNNLNRSKPLYWLHVSSVGEYENARAVAHVLKKKHDCTLLVSVYSYSAYSQRMNDEMHDIIFVLPFDLYFSTKKLVSRINADLVLYSKYDVWPNMARACFQNGTRQTLFSASLPETSKRYSGIFRSFYRRVYGFLDVIYAISEPSRQRLLTMNPEVIMAGDTRYDAIASRSAEIPAEVSKLIKAFKKNRLLVGGSTYLTSEAFLAEALVKEKDLQLVLAPHHVDKAHLESIKVILKKFKLDYVFYSELQGQPGHDARVLVIDVMGILAYLYDFADFVYVGGGWQGSVHSVLEPAFFARPILTGPAIERFQEAIDLANAGLLTIMKEESPQQVLDFIDQAEKNRETLTRGLEDFFQQQSGASIKIVEDLQKRGILA